ncbi:hypothetical protein EUZ93_01695 [Wolbachia pipientis]|nr:hypothetical protein [Wolbachia pipientis]
MIFTKIIIHDVLSNSFTVKYGYINCTIKYDNLSGQEQNQIETDIKTAYEAFKEKFCLKNSNASYNITVRRLRSEFASGKSRYSAEVIRNSIVEREKEIREIEKKYVRPNDLISERRKLLKQLLC